MIGTPNLDEILGAEVVDPNNDSVGRVGRIYLDPDLDVPTWVSVKTGLFGLAESLVPVDDATWEGDVLHVTVDKARIKDAPRVDADQEIAPEDQEKLYSYYERDATGAAGGGASGDYGTGTGLGTGAGGGTADYGASTAGSGAAGRGRHAGPGDDLGAAGASGAVASGLGAHAAGHRGEPLGDEPLGGGNHNPAAFERGDEEQRMRDAGRSAGDGQLGGGAQNPGLLEGREQFGADPGELGGGNQNPALYEQREDRDLDAGDLGGGNQNPGGFRQHTGVGASTHGGPGEFTGSGADPADASRRAAERDDPGRMRMSEGGTGEQQGGAMHLADDRGATAGGDAAMGTTGAQGVSSPSGTGRMRLRRYVVTEQQTVTMPVTREEYRLEPDDGSDEQR